MRQFLSTNEILCDHGDPDTAAPHTHSSRVRSRKAKNLANKGLHSSSLQMFWRVHVHVKLPSRQDAQPQVLVPVAVIAATHEKLRPAA